MRQTEPLLSYSLPVLLGTSHAGLNFITHMQGCLSRRQEVTGASFLQLMLVLYGTTLIMTCLIQAVTGCAHGQNPSGQIRKTMNKLVFEEGGRESRQTPE